MLDYSKRLVEVDEILNYLPKEDYKKIPSEILNLIKSNKSSSYTWSFDKSIPLEAQSLNKDTIAILAYINFEFLLPVEEKSLMEKLYNINFEKENKIKEEKYSIDKLFKNKSHDIDSVNTEKYLIEYKKDNLLKKIIKLIKNILKIKK